jgi:hypothetical protein
LACRGKEHSQESSRTARLRGAPDVAGLGGGAVVACSRPCSSARNTVRCLYRGCGASRGKSSSVSAASRTLHISPHEDRPGALAGESVLRVGASTGSPRRLRSCRELQPRRESLGVRKSLLARSA